MHNVLRILAAVSVCLGILLVAAGASVLLINVDGPVGSVSAVGATVALAAALGYGASRWGRKLGDRVFAITTTATGSMAASIAVAIVLASTSAEWRLHARSLPHPGRSWLAFGAVAAGLLPIGIPALRTLIRKGKLFRLPETPPRAPIDPGGQRDEVYRDER